MDRVVLNSIPFRVDTEKLIKVLHVCDDDIDRFKQLVNEAQVVGKPVGLFKPACIESKGDNFVDIDGIRFTSRVLRVNIENTQKVFAFVVTCGLELEAWSHSISDILERYWADIIKEMILCSTMEVLNSYIKENYPVGTISLMTPGSLDDWPMEEQKHLFKLIGNVQESIGVELTESYLMIPVKSISGIIFPMEKSFVSCQLCSRERCPGRKVPYDGGLYNEKYCML